MNVFAPVMSTRHECVAQTKEKWLRVTATILYGTAWRVGGSSVRIGWRISRIIVYLSGWRRR